MQSKTSIPQVNNKKTETNNMSMKIFSILEVIPQSNIVVFSPHFDDFLFMLGGYASELKKCGQLNTKKIHITILFSKSNYLARSGKENFNNSLDRLKLATENVYSKTRNALMKFWEDSITVMRLPEKMNVLQEEKNLPIVKWNFPMACMKILKRWITRFSKE